MLVLVCPGGLADLPGTDPTGTQTVAVDGKTARGSRTEVQAAARLLAAVTGAGNTVTQLRVPAKTSEVTGFARLLAPFDLSGVTVTADALHTQRDHARYLVEEKNAHYFLLVKGNRPRLHATLRSLPWNRVRARRYGRERGHGRRETRSTRVLTVTDLHLDFPTSSRPRRSCGTAPTCARARSPARPSTRSPTCPPSRRPRSGWPNSPARSGPSRTGSTSCATPPSPRTHPRSAPDTASRTWPPCATSPSTPSAELGTAVSQPASAKPPMRPTPTHSTYSTCPDQQRSKATATMNQPCAVDLGSAM